MDFEPLAQSESSQSTSKAEISDWLNQSYKQSPCEDHSLPPPNDHDASSNHEVGLISALYQACLSLYGGIHKECRLGSRYPQALQGHTSQNLERFILLSETLEHSKVDLCLCKAPEVSDGIIKTLYDVGRTLTKGMDQQREFPGLDVANASRTGAASLGILPPKWSIDCPLPRSLQEFTLQMDKARLVLSPDDESDDMLDNITAFEHEGFMAYIDVRFNDEINTYITDLADLVPTIQGLLHEESQAQGKHRDGADTLTFHVSDSAKPYVMQIREKYPNAPIKLVERLGEANWQRFVRIRRRMHENEELDGDPQTEKTSPGFQSIFVTTEFHDSGLGRSVNFGPHLGRSFASDTSFLSSQSNSGRGRRQVPPTPREVLDGSPFTCLICRHELVSIRSDKEWKAHVYYDLQPYICTFDGCRDALTMYPTRNLWADHEFQEHRVNRFLTCYCTKTYTDPETFSHHLKYQHLFVLNHGQLLTQLSAAETTVEQPLQEQQCPLCLQDGWTSESLFTRHVGGHLENIALGSLPRDCESDSEGCPQQSGSSTPLFASTENHAGSLSVPSEPKAVPTVQSWGGISTYMHEADPSSQDFGAQQRVPHEEIRLQVPGSVHELTAARGDLDQQHQSPQALARGPVPVQDLWADGLVTHARVSGRDLQEEVTLSTQPESPPSRVRTTVKSTPNSTWRELETNGCYLQQQPWEQPRQVMPQFTPSYGQMQHPVIAQGRPHGVEDSLCNIAETSYGRTEFPSYTSNARSTMQGCMQSQGPKEFGEPTYSVSYPRQDYLDKLMHSPLKHYVQPETHDMLTLQPSNFMSSTLQPIPYHEMSQPPGTAGPEQYVNPNTDTVSVSLSSQQPTLASDRHDHDTQEVVNFDGFDAFRQGSTSSEPLRAGAASYATNLPESQRSGKRRKPTGEQMQQYPLNYGIGWQGPVSLPEAQGPQPAVLTRDGNTSAFESLDAAEIAHRSNTQATKDLQSAPNLASNLRTECGPKPLAPFASQGSTQADIVDLDVHRQIISDMYISKNWTLADVRKYMAEEHNVVASEKQYKTYLKRTNMKKNFDGEDVSMMLSLRREVAQRGQVCKMYWCGKEVTLAKLQSYLRKKKVTETHVLANAHIPTPIPSHIVVEILPHHMDSSKAPLQNSSDQLDPDLHGPALTASPPTARPPDGAGRPKRRACVACRRRKVKCDFSGELSDGEGSNTSSCMRCRREHKDCVVRQPRRHRSPPVPRHSGKRKRGLSATTAASSTSGTTNSNGYEILGESEDTNLTRLFDEDNFENDDST